MPAWVGDHVGIWPQSWAGYLAPNGTSETNLPGLRAGSSLAPSVLPLSLYWIQMPKARLAGLDRS